MSFDAIVWARAQVVGNPIRKLILLEYANCANPQTGNEVWHAASTIAQMCECSRSAVFKHLGILVDDGYLSLISQSTRRHETNRYRLNVNSVVVASGPGEPDAQGSPKRAKRAVRSPDGLQGSPDGLQGSPDDTITVSETVKETVSTSIVSTADAVERRAEEQLLLNLNPKGSTMSNEDHMLVLDAYARILPELSQPNRGVWIGSPSATKLQRRWRESPEYRTAEFWITFFTVVRANDWYMEHWRTGERLACNLHWLLETKSFESILVQGGRYDEQ